jgi:splicing factor U2AF subunit
MGAPPAAAAYAAPPPPLPAAPAAPLPPAGGAGGSFISGEPSTLLRLTNMVTAAEVAEDGEYRELCDEIGEELRRYGRLVQLTIPREGPGVGNVFAAFADVNEALAAARAVAGRVFAGRTIAVHFERG